MSFVFPEPQDNERAAALGLDITPASFGEGFGASFDDAMTRNPTPTLMRAGNRLQYFPSTDEFGNEMPARTPSKMLTSREANEQYGIEGHLKFDADIPEPIAQELKGLKQRELERQETMRRAQAGLGTSLTAGLVATMLDPLNVASAFIPVVGEARFAALAGRIGVGGARAVTGAVEGAVGAAILEPIVLAGARYEQADYDIVDSLANIAFGAGMGAGLHFAGGALKDRIEARRTASPIERQIDDLPRADQEALARTAVAQMSEGRPIDVGPILDTMRTTRRQDLLNGTSARAFDQGGDPQIKLAFETPSAQEFLQRMAPDLASQVDELKNRAAGYRQLLAEMGDDKLAVVSARFGERIGELQAELATADKKRGREIASELSNLYAERVKAREQASVTTGDIDEMTTVRAELIKTDEALRDLSTQLSDVTAKAEKKAANVRAEADRLMAKLAPTLESGRATDELLFPLDRAADTSAIATRVDENVRYSDPLDAESADVATRRVAEEQGQARPVTDEVKTIEEDLAYLESLIPADREAPGSSPAEKEARTRAKAYKAAAACAVRKG